MAQSNGSAIRPIDRLLERLSGVRRTGPEKWMACCPAHDDTNPSLSITETTDGTVLVNCFAGCDTEAVLAAVGLTMADLFPADSSGPRLATAARTAPTGRAPTESRQKPERGPVVATYDYMDPAGHIRYQIQRHDPKEFTVRRPNGRGSWINNAKGVELILYHADLLAEAVADDHVFVCEGEKDVDRLVALVGVATTFAFGAEAWARHAEGFQGSSGAATWWSFPTTTTRAEGLPPKSPGP